MNMEYSLIESVDILNKTETAIENKWKPSKKKPTMKKIKTTKVKKSYVSKLLNFFDFEK